MFDEFMLTTQPVFYPSAIKDGPAVTNSALTEKLTHEFCLLFTDMTYVPGQYIPYIFFAPSHKRPFFKMAA